MDFTTPVQYLKGCGERRAAVLAQRGIHTIGDLLYAFPRAYEDWSAVVSITEGARICASHDAGVCVRALALTDPTPRRLRGNLTLYQFPVSDGIATMTVTLFNNKYAAAKIKRGEEYLFFGQIEQKFGRCEMASPLIEPIGTSQDAARIRPLYRASEGLPSRAMEQLVQTALAEVTHPEDILPEELRARRRLCERAYALTNIHAPTDHTALETARRRLVFEELLLLQLGLLRLKGRERHVDGIPIPMGDSAAFEALLPFTLTGAQQRAIADCLVDMQGEQDTVSPMGRLIQGDVGSGKTAVAAGVAFAVMQAGYQAAMMAPTEILAEQHAASLSRLLAPAGIEAALLTGQIGRASCRERV